MTIDEALQLGVQHHQAGRLPEAEQLYRQVLGAMPNHPDALHLMGMLARRAGHHVDAERFIRRAIETNPSTAEYHGNLGLVLADQLKNTEAIAAYRMAILWKPHFAAAHCNLGAALQAEGKLDEAIAAYQMALRCQPEFAQALANMGNALSEQKQYDRAIESLQAADRLLPGNDKVLYNLGNALMAAHRLPEARDAFLSSLQTNPDNLPARCNLGNVHRSLGQFDEAIACYLKCIQINPMYVDSHWNLSLAYLQLGDFEHGWPEHEWRLQVNSLSRPQPFPQPRWYGQPLNGKAILLHPEQGLGDTLQFARYASMVADRGGKVILQVQPELQRLLAHLPGMFQVIGQGENFAPPEVQCPLMSLPFVFDTRLDSIPAQIPYLLADAGMVSAWRDKIGSADDKLNVGVVWAGGRAHKNDQHRSMPATVLSPLLNVPGFGWFSLQKDAGASGLDLIDHTAELHDFADTAAVIANLDLVITVDTAVAHLAGAMGRPVWVLLAHDADWRWLLNRSDSPWYPTMRLFRQENAGDWAGVIGRVRQALLQLSPIHTRHV